MMTTSIRKKVYEEHGRGRAGVPEIVTKVDPASNRKIGGVLLDGEFVPWKALGYSPEYGYFDKTSVPSRSDAQADDWSIHPLDGEDWDAFVLIDEGGHSCLLGEKWQVEELYYTLHEFVQQNVVDEPVGRRDAFGYGATVSTDEACAIVHEHNPEEYPLGDKLGNRIRIAAKRGSIAYARSPNGGYRYYTRSLQEWLKKKEPKK